MNPLSVSLLTALLWAAAPAPEPTPADQGPDTASTPPELDRIVVTGSRIPRIDIEGPLPVSMISRETLRAGGALNLADALRDSPFNSFGSFGEVPNSSLPTLAVPSLRGLGGKYTLTLLDGFRLPGVAEQFSGAASSLTGIPLSAIDRVEVLRDGASAVYGSEAIGGVINLLTRRSGPTRDVELQWERPSAAGGDAYRASALLGEGDADRRGSWLLALEWLDREPLSGAQRPYLLDNAPTSVTGNPGSFRRLDPQSGRPLTPFEPDPRCPQAFDSNPLFPNSRVQRLGPGQACVYRFRAENFERAALQSRSLFARGQFDTAGDLRLEARLLALRNDSRTQLAAGPSAFELAADAPTNPTLGERGPGLGFPLILLYRLTALGPRVSVSREDTLHALAALRGSHRWAAGGEWSLALVSNHYRKRDEGISGFARLSLVEAALASGQFDPFNALPGDSTGLEQAIYAARDHSRSSNQDIEGSADIEAEWFARPTRFAVGFDLRRDAFSVRNDPLRQSGDIIGSFVGVDQNASRNYGALHGEALQAISERLELIIAARYDRYQDAGDAFSPKLSLGWRPHQAHMLRASFGRGFQAPDLRSAYGSVEGSLGIGVDRVACAESGGDPLACALGQFDAAILPNPGLAPERARQGGIGWIWQPSEAINLALDYYRTRITDQVGVLAPQQALDFELACQLEGRSCDLLSEGGVLRRTNGLIERILLPRINQSLLRSAGLDLELRARADTRLGEFAFSLDASRVLELGARLRRDGPIEDRLARFGNPRWRAVVGLDWKRAAHGLRLSLRHNDGFAGCFAALDFAGNPNPNCALRVRSHSEIDLQWRWRLAPHSEFTLGARNLAERELPLGPGGEIAYGLHDPIGRVWYARYRMSF